MLGLILALLLGQAQAAAAEPADAAAAAKPPDEATSSTRKLRRQQAHYAKLLPAHDRQDPVAYPRWFRILLRRNLKGLPESGNPQYPAKAGALLAWLKASPRHAKSELEARLAELEKEVPAVKADNDKLAKYSAWDVKVPKGSELDRIRQKMQPRADLLPESDLEDQTALPSWFRAYLREKYPDLPKSGKYQYPDSAQVMFSTLLNRARHEGSKKPSTEVP